ncbi:hypothetical protein WDU94_012861, partial [Cyamophila willieti]
FYSPSYIITSLVHSVLLVFSFSHRLFLFSSSIFCSIPLCPYSSSSSSSSSPFILLVSFIVLLLFVGLVVSSNEVPLCLIQYLGLLHPSISHST